MVDEVYIGWLGGFLLFGIVGMMLFFLVSEDPLSMGLGFGVYSGLISLIMVFEGKSFFGCLLFWVFVGTMLVMFCMVVSMAPNPVFRLFSVFVLIVSYVVYVLMVEVFLLEYDVWLSYMVGGGGLNSSGVTMGELGVDCFSGIWWSGEMYVGLGVFDGVGWGSLLVYSAFIMMLSVISVVNLCSRSSGSLVRFVVKG